MVPRMTRPIIVITKDWIAIKGTVCASIENGLVVNIIFKRSCISSILKKIVQL